MSPIAILIIRLQAKLRRRPFLQSTLLEAEKLADELLKAELERSPVQRLPDICPAEERKGLAA